MKTFVRSAVLSMVMSIVSLAPMGCSSDAQQAASDRAAGEEKVSVSASSLSLLGPGERLELPLGDRIYRFEPGIDVSRIDLVEGEVVTRLDRALGDWVSASAGKITLPQILSQPFELRTRLPAGAQAGGLHPQALCSRVLPKVWCSGSTCDVSDWIFVWRC